MLAIAYDAKRLIQFALHVREALTEAEIATLLAAIGRLAVTVDERPGAVATSIIIVETDHAPTATQRRRIADAAAKIQRSREVVITASPLIRGVMTAIRWLARADSNHVQATFANYADSRRWLVTNTGHPAEAFDALHEAVRAQVSATHRA